jgi:hypothetical protein
MKQINPKEYLEKCLKNRQFPSNDFLKQIILKRIMQDFNNNQIYSEKEVDQIIKKYFDDYTLIRRELINFGYMQRDPIKMEYKVVKKELSKEDYENNTLLKRHAKDIEIIK